MITRDELLQNRDTLERQLASTATQLEQIRGALMFADQMLAAFAEDDDPGIEDDGAVVPDVSEPARSE